MIGIRSPIAVAMALATGGWYKRNYDDDITQPSDPMPTYEGRVAADVPQTSPPPTRQLRRLAERRAAKDRRKSGR